MGEGATRAPRGKTVLVDDQIQALIMKKALATYVVSLGKKDTGDSFIPTEDLIASGNTLIDRVDGLAFFHRSEAVVPRKKGAASKKITPVEAGGNV